MDMTPEVALKDEGLRLLKEGKVVEAIAVFDEVLNNEPDDYQLHMYLGIANCQKGDRLRSIHHLEESVRLCETPKGYYNLGMAYERSNRVDEAIRQYRMALTLDPNYSNAQAALDKLQQQFQAAHPAPQPESEPATHFQGANVTQAMPPPQAGPIGQAPIFDQPAPPPSGPNPFEYQMKQQQAIIEARNAMIKSGMIYGAICGPLMVYFSVMVLTWRGFFPIGVWSSALGIIGIGVAGLIYGGLVGFWVGNTCGGEGAGMQAGAALGAAIGIVMGLFTGTAVGCIIEMFAFAIGGGLSGMLIGRMVDASTAQI